MIRRTQTIYVTLEPFLSLRGAVLHHFDQFLAGLDEAEFPCIWLTGLTRAQLDEPRRRLGHNDPFIGESGCGVYLPEDYFHLKSGNTIRLGRFTCIPVATPQPAAAEALDDLSTDLNISTVSLRSLSARELSQNTGLPASEAEQVQMRDFDELFFFAGASATDIAKFAEEAKLRNLTLQNVGAFWSLSCGADLGKCIRELGGLYDRATRTHALRVAVAVSSAPDIAQAMKADSRLQALAAFCDRTVLLTEEQSEVEIDSSTDSGNDSDEESSSNESSDHAIPASAPRSVPGRPLQNSFPINSPNLWDTVLASILARR